MKHETTFHYGEICPMPNEKKLDERSRVPFLLVLELEDINKLLTGTAFVVRTKNPGYETFAVCKEGNRIKIFKVIDEITVGEDYAE